MTALVAEHFVRQSTASSTIAEAGAPTSAYLLSLSTSLVALGFANDSPDAFGPMAAAVIPTLPWPAPSARSTRCSVLAAGALAHQRRRVGAAFPAERR